MYEVLARPGTTFLLSHKRNLRDMTYSNWLTDFLSKLFMKIDNRINQGFFLLLFSVFQISRIYFMLCFFLITNSAFLQSDNFMREGREFLDLWSNTCCECWRCKMCLKSPEYCSTAFIGWFFGLSPKEVLDWNSQNKNKQTTKLKNFTCFSYAYIIHLLWKWSTQIKRQLAFRIPISQSKFLK